MMTKISILIITILTTIIMSNANAQYREIKTGEQIPNFTFTDVYNSKQKVIHINDYRGKLIILDFWGTYCAPCLKAFPFLDSLQREFNDKIQILTVANISSEKIASYFKKYVHVFKPNLPFIASANFLNTAFPHTGVPFQIWISPTGKVLLYGDPSQLTRSNIKKALSSGIANYRKASKNVYASVIDDRYKNLVTYASVISRYKSDSLRMHPNLDSKKRHLFEVGPIPFLYQRAFSDSTYKFLDVYSKGHIVLEVKNLDKYIKNPNFHGDDAIKWNDENYYNYQLIEPDDYTGNMYQKMKDDLDNYFGLSSKVEKKLVDCYVLVSTGDTLVTKSKGGAKFNNFFKMNDILSTEYTAVRYLKNQPFVYFSNAVKDMVEYGLKMPFFDESGIKGNVDMEIGGKTLDQMIFNEWQAELKKYNLKLIEKQELIDVLVLREIDRP